MKKTLFFAAAAIAMLASCSQNDLEAPVVAQSQQGAVEFGTYVAGTPGTRALTPGGKTGEMTTETLKNGTEGADSGFGVIAYSTGSTAWATAKTTAIPNFMYNEHVYWDNTNTKWIYSPLKYWPNEFANGAVDNQTAPAAGSTARGMVSFFAYGPYAGTVSQDVDDAVNGAIVANTPAGGIIKMSGNNYQGEPCVYYKFNSAAPVDLLWGARGNSTGYEQTAGSETTEQKAASVNTDLVKQKTNETVDFNFKHRISAIAGTAGLKAQVVPSNGSLTDTKVSITSVSINDNSTANVKSCGTLNLATGVFTVDDTSAEAKAVGPNVTYATDDILEDYATVTAPANWAAVKGLANTTATAILKDGKVPMYFMPGATPKITVTVTYKVYTEDNKLKAGWSEVEQTISKDITFTSAVEYGKRYIILMKLGLEDVDFEASVANWEDGASEVEVNLPINVAAPVTP